YTRTIYFALKIYARKRGLWHRRLRGLAVRDRVTRSSITAGGLIMAGWHRFALPFVGFTAVLVVVAGGPATTVAAKKLKAGLTAEGRAASEEAASGRQPDLLKHEQELRAIRAEKLTKEVLRTIEAVRRQSSSDPDSALAGLKRTLTAVISSTDIDPD